MILLGALVLPADGLLGMALGAEVDPVEVLQAGYDVLQAVPSELLQGGRLRRPQQQRSETQKLHAQTCLKKGVGEAEHTQRQQRVGDPYPQAPAQGVVGQAVGRRRHQRRGEGDQHLHVQQTQLRHILKDALDISEILQRIDM